MPFDHHHVEPISVSRSLVDCEKASQSKTCVLRGQKRDVRQGQSQSVSYARLSFTYTILLQVVPSLGGIIPPQSKLI